jgi:hypothetical protein
MTHTSLLILLVLTFGAVTARSQDRPDSTKPKLEFPADSAASAVNSHRGNDKFVDADGDGICDGRAKGLGLRRGITKGHGQGKDAAGQKKWRGGRK